MLNEYYEMLSCMFEDVKEKPQNVVDKFVDVKHHKDNIGKALSCMVHWCKIHRQIVRTVRTLRFRCTRLLRLSVAWWTNRPTSTVGTRTLVVKEHAT